jgi:hypothetical protein
MNICVHTALSRTALALAMCLTAGVSPAQTTDDERAAEAAPAASPTTWPHQFKQGDLTFTVYPPQLDRWQSDRLEGRAAVSVQSPGSDKPLFGIVSLTARTEMDNAANMVSLRDITVSRASFPTATDRAGIYLEAVRQHLAALTWKVAADRLRADLAIDHAAQQAQSQPLRNDPPRIVYTQSATILVPIDGQPVLREMMGLGLMRVLNTRALILVDKSTGRYFLSVAGRWLEAPSLDGPWTDGQVRPIALDEAKQQAVDSGQVDLLEGSGPDGRTPRVIVSTVPTELIQTDGSPQYSPIERTQLLYVTNSPNRLFLELPTQQHYVLLAGRWYRTRSLTQGPWEYVPGAGLPPDFALIPDGHPTETVRAAVPGTPQAQEAVIANSVPQVATVRRSAARLEFTYDGPPQFRPIEGTALESAVNAPMPVIQVDWRNYYALDNGVWFFSESPDGPWTAATWVPPVIYSIPHSSPLHYVTYVRVYDATADDVYVGYTPGYVGSYVALNSTVVYGTGWAYSPWIGSVWYCPPVTWGFGFSFWYTWWNPWPWRPVVWAGWGAPRPFFRPWWGPWAAPVAVRPVPFQRGVPVAATRAVVPVNRWTTNQFNASNVTGIYRRWGPGVAATPAAARPSAQVATSAAGTPGTWSGNPEWHAYRQRDGQGQRFVGNGQWENVRPPVANVQRSPLPAAATPSAGAPPIAQPRQNTGTALGAPAALSRPGQNPTRTSPWQGERPGSRLPASGSPRPSGAPTPLPPRATNSGPGPTRGPAVPTGFVNRQPQGAAVFDRPAAGGSPVASRPPSGATMGPSTNAPRGAWHGHGNAPQMRGRF